MRKATLIAVGVMVFGLISGCSSKNVKESDSTSTQLVTVEMTTELEPLTSEEVSSDATVQEGADVSELQEDYDVIVSNLLGGLNYIDEIGGGNIPKDESQTVVQGDKTYALVVKTQFASTADLRDYMNSILTQECIAGRYSGILDGDSPYYIDVDGALYGYVTAKGCGFAWILEDGNPVYTISDQTDTQFVVHADYDDFGGKSTLKLTVIDDNGEWKIDKIEF